MSSLVLQPELLTTNNLKLIKARQHLQQATSSLSAAQNRPSTLNMNMRIQLRDLQSDLNSLQHRLNKLETHVKESGYAYAEIEHKLSSQAKAIAQTMPISNRFSESVFGTALAASGSALHSQRLHTPTHSSNKKESLYGTWQFSTWDGYHDSSTNIKTSTIFKAALKDGLKGDLSIGGSALKVSRDDRVGGLLNHAEFGVGNVAVTGSAKALLFKDHTFDPELHLSVNAIASAAKGIVSAKWRNEYLEASAKGTIQVGVAQAKGTAIINKKEVKLDGNVGVAALQGEAVGSINVFGVKITASAKGEIGAMGIGGTVGKTSNSFELGGKISCLLGTGFHIKFEW